LTGKAVQFNPPAARLAFSPIVLIETDKRSGDDAVKGSIAVDSFKGARRGRHTYLTTEIGMSDSSKDLAARIQELEDVREINEVWFKWHYSCTGGFNGKQAGRMEALECLTEDATIEIAALHKPGQGPKGRAAYTEFWDFYFGDDGPLPYVFQTSVAEKVVITGDTAVQYSNMLGIFQPRGHKPGIGLSQRINDLVRTPDGWRISKTTQGGGYSIQIDELQGALNKLPDFRPRPEWKYKG
jgi:hypothetical protein